MIKKGIEWISAYFGDKRMVVVVGFGCLVYMVLYFIPDLKITRIFPPMPFQYYVVLGAVVGFYQGAAWKSFRFFKTDWNKSLMSYVLFFSEFMILFFAMSVLSWPCYLVYRFFLYLLRLN